MALDRLNQKTTNDSIMQQMESMVFAKERRLLLEQYVVMIEVANDKEMQMQAYKNICKPKDLSQDAVYAKLESERDHAYQQANQMMRTLSERFGSKVVAEISQANAKVIELNPDRLRIHERIYRDLAELEQKKQAYQTALKEYAIARVEKEAYFEVWSSTSGIPASVHSKLPPHIQISPELKKLQLVMANKCFDLIQTFNALKTSPFFDPTQVALMEIYQSHNPPTRKPEYQQIYDSKVAEFKAKPEFQDAAKAMREVLQKEFDQFGEDEFKQSPRFNLD